VVTADALHAQRGHAEYLMTQRGAHYLITVKRNQPGLHAQLAALPWRQVPVACQALPQPAITRTPGPFSRHGDHPPDEKGCSNGSSRPAGQHPGLRDAPPGHHRALIIDDLALQPLDATSTTDFYELCVERHQKAATIVTSNRTPDEWLTMMADPLLAQSAVDRLTSTCHELVIEGESYRRRQRPGLHRPDRHAP